MGGHWCRLMKRRYSAEAAAKDIKAVYEWILNGREKPKFVYK